MKKDKMSKNKKKEKQKAMVRLCLKITHLFSIHQFKGTGQEHHSIPAPSFRFPVCYLTRQSFFFISHNVCRLFPSRLLDSKPLRSSSRLQMTSYSLKNKHRSTEKRTVAHSHQAQPVHWAHSGKTAVKPRESDMMALLETEWEEKASKQSDQPSWNIDWLTIFIITPNLPH